MNTTGRYSAHEETERNPSEPFIEDIKKDIKQIDTYYLKNVANNIKKDIIKVILDSME